MKKFYSFFPLILALIIFACTIPTEIEVRGTVPSLKFAASMDFGEMFQDMVKDAFSNDNQITVLDCINITDKQTYLVHMEAVDETYSFAPGGMGSTVNIGGVEINVSQIADTYTLTQDAVLFNSRTGSDITLPLASFSDIIENFNFKTNNVKAKLYVNSNFDVLRYAKVDLEFYPLNSDGIEQSLASSMNIPAFPDTQVVLQKSNILLNSGVYAGTALPAHGNYEITGFTEMLNDKCDYRVHLKIVLPSGTSFNTSLLGEDVDVTTELVVWMPLEFQPDITYGASILFPDEDFEGIGDFIDSLTGMMESLSLVIGMNRNPFSQGILIMEDAGLKIMNPLGVNSLNFIINESDMKRIEYLNKDFKPKFSIYFAPGTSFVVPRSLRTTTVSLVAKLKYLIEL